MSMTIENTPLLADLRAARETFWVNPGLQSAAEGIAATPVTLDDVRAADARLRRFAPLIARLFPETAGDSGLIESPLTPIPRMGEALGVTGLLLKRDADLPIAGSVKARGGIYEILKHTEDLALDAGLLESLEDDHEKLLDPASRAFFAGKKVQVGSTGNLGMSIGIMSAALGYEAIVHMSADAKGWKKDLLRARGATVREYAGDYGAAVAAGRAASDADPDSYFVDDENSRDLFLGYAVAALRLQEQLGRLGIPVDERHPLFVHIPCGVGGAPGGVTFGLKAVFGDAVHCFFAEPTQSPCMLLGMATGLHNAISVQDIGLTGLTEADGLAVGRASGFVGRVMEPLLSGVVTVADGRLLPYLRRLWETEGIFIEPSACAAFRGVDCAELAGYIRARELEGVIGDAHHIVWSTGGRLVPEDVRREMVG